MFLDESARKLQRVFDSECAFRNCNDCLLDQVEHVLKNEVSSMRVAIGKLRYDSDSNSEGIVPNTYLISIRIMSKFMMSKE